VTARAAVGNPVLAELTDDGHGRLAYRGGRFVLIRPETLAALQRAVEAALGQPAAGCFVAAGRAGGARAAPGLEGRVEERAAALARMGTALGWGEFTVDEATPTSLVVTVRGSALADAHGPSIEPVCHLIRGVLSAFVATVHASPVEVIETACAATGAAACRFETTSTGGAPLRGR
jgi:predicted hydrocarbon binding protein